MLNTKEISPLESIYFWKVVWVCVSFILLLLFSIVNYFYHNDFMSQSIELSLFFQLLPSYFRYYFWVFTTIVYFVVLLFPYIILFYSSKKDKAIYFFLVIQFQMIITETLKIVVHDTRPCLKSDRLAEIACSCSFGMNSGHSSSTFTFYFMLFFFYDQKIKSLTLKSFMFVLIGWSVFSVGLSRIYYGAHSWNQVLFGFLLGNLIVSLTMFFKKRAIRFISSILEDKKEDRDWKLFYSIACASANVFLNVVVLIMYKFLRRNFDSGNNSWLVTSRCAYVCFLDGKSLSSSHLMGVSQYTPCGFLMLFIVLGKRGRTINSPDFFGGQFSSLWLFLKRMFLFLIVASPVLFGMIFRFILPFWVAVILNWTLGIIFCALFVFDFPKLLRRYNATIPGDYFIEEEYSVIEERETNPKEIEGPNLA